MVSRSVEERTATRSGARTVKWLIVRYSAIGDCVMAAHVPSRVRRFSPDASIHWAVEDRCSAVIDTEVLCQGLHVFARDAWKKRTWSPSNWRSVLAFYARLRAQRFDVGLDLQGHSKTAICLRIAKPKRRLAIRATDPFAARLNPIMTQPSDIRHSVELALHCLAQVSEADSDSSPIMPRLVDERRKVRSLVPAGKALATVSIGATKVDKLYPYDRWIEVVVGLQRMGYHVAILGGPSDAFPDVESATNLVAKLSLPESMAAIAESSVSLAADTGAGHIAAAFGVPVVSVFGPTDPEVFRPYTEKGVVLRYGASTQDVSPLSILDAAESLTDRYGQIILD